MKALMRPVHSLQRALLQNETLKQYSPSVSHLLSWSHGRILKQDGSGCCFCNTIPTLKPSNEEYLTQYICGHFNVKSYSFSLPEGFKDQRSKEAWLGRSLGPKLRPKLRPKQLPLKFDWLGINLGFLSQRKLPLEKEASSFKEASVPPTKAISSINHVNIFWYHSFSCQNFSFSVLNVCKVDK